MPGRRPIFFSLMSSIYHFFRDLFFKAMLEPESPAKRRVKRIKKGKKKKMK